MVGLPAESHYKELRAKLIKNNVQLIRKTIKCVKVEVQITTSF